jgi:hypothetical protein
MSSDKIRTRLHCLPVDRWPAPPPVLACYPFQHHCNCLQLRRSCVHQDLPKSQTGLLRSLLHSVLREHRNLITKVLPGFYDDVAGLIMHKRNGLEPVSAPEVKLAFLKMIDSLPDYSRLCLFIDGIDEYQGNHTDIIEMLKAIASPKVKIVLSGRPMISENVLSHSKFTQISNCKI